MITIAARRLALTGLLCLPLAASAFDSGSTGADGAFNPTASIEVAPPPDGIFNYTEVNVPADVVVTFSRNVGNTPVRWLVSGDVVIDGEVRLDGGDGGSSLTGGGAAGVGGPGGFDGGAGGLFASSGDPRGGDGFGPGAGTGGEADGGRFSEGGSGGFGSAGTNGSYASLNGTGGPAYGNPDLLPLIGGSGGGGGKGDSARGSGGGGGGGALLIAADGTVTVNGIVSANGGDRGDWRTNNGSYVGGYGGTGSGGAIRIVATTVAGEGIISAATPRGTGDGRIRLEAERLLRARLTTPGFSYSGPRPAIFANAPTIRIASVAGVDTPAFPSGFRDVVLPGVTSNPVTVEFETAGVPTGTVISLTATPPYGTTVMANSTGVTGTEAQGTDSISIALPNGNSVLRAQTTFTITASAGDVLARYTDGERVEAVRLAFAAGEGLSSTYVTTSGREVTWAGGRRLR